MSSDWSQQLAEELHKPITKNFRKRRVISYGIDEIWAADLVQKYSKWNKGIKYLLMVIDVFSKYGWIKPLKDKKTESVSLAFDTYSKRVNENLRRYGLTKDQSLSVNILKNFWRKIMLNYITLKMTKNQALLKDGIKP